MPIRMAKIKKTDSTPNGGKDVDQVKLFYIAGGKVKHKRATLENSLVVSHKGKDIPTLRTQMFYS